LIPVASIYPASVNRALCLPRGPDGFPRVFITLRFHDLRRPWKSRLRVRIHPAPPTSPYLWGHSLQAVKWRAIAASFADLAARGGCRPVFQAREFLENVESLARKASAESSTRRMNGATSNDDSVRSLSDFHADPRYGGDFQRADTAWALHAASRGLLEQQIRDEILHARDLSKKADLCASSITRNGPRSRRSVRSSRYAERAAPLWTARRNQVAARHRSACRSRFAALDVVRRSTASAPPYGSPRSVTLAACTSGGSGLRATVEVWVRRLRLKDGAGERKQARPGIR
jgi:hypothetical protein